MSAPPNFPQPLAISIGKPLRWNEAVSIPQGSMREGFEIARLHGHEIQAGQETTPKAIKTRTWISEITRVHFNAEKNKKKTKCKHWLTMKIVSRRPILDCSLACSRRVRHGTPKTTKKNEDCICLSFITTNWILFASSASQAFSSPCVPAHSFHHVRFPLSCPCPSFPSPAFCMYSKRENTELKDGKRNSQWAQLKHLRWIRFGYVHARMRSV